MKSIFIISSYPSTPQKLTILKECLNSVKDMGFDVLLTTNYPINDPEIYSLVDYLIWDKTDVQSLSDVGLDIEVTTLNWGWFMKGTNFTARTAFDNAYHFDLHRSLRNGVSLAQGLNYDFFYYLEGDNMILDKQHLIDTRDKMFKEDKKLLFIEMQMGAESGGYFSYVTTIFGGTPSYFLESTKDIPCDINRWTSNVLFYGNGMEVIFYKVLGDKKENILILKSEDFDDKILFNRIRKASTYGFKNMLFFDKEELYILIYNENIYTAQIVVKIDEIPWITATLYPNCYHINKIDINSVMNKTIKNVVNINEEELIYSKLINQKNLDILKNTQKIEFY